MRNPFAFYGWTVIVLVAAGLLISFYGVPMLHGPVAACHYARTRSFGCSSSFGTFMTFLSAGLAVVIGGRWNRFGR